MVDKTSSQEHPETTIKHPLADPKKVIERILANGSVIFSKHAKVEMAKDGLTAPDIVNVLRGGVSEPWEFEGGSYRYRMTTKRMCVVVAIRSEAELIVVTAWRFKT